VGRTHSVCLEAWSSSRRRPARSSPWSARGARPRQTHRDCEPQMRRAVGVSRSLPRPRARTTSSGAWRPARDRLHVMCVWSLLARHRRAWRRARRAVTRTPGSTCLHGFGIGAEPAARMSMRRSGLFTLRNAKIVPYALADSWEPSKPGTGIGDVVFRRERAARRPSALPAARHGKKKPLQAQRAAQERLAPTAGCPGGRVVTYCCSRIRIPSCAAPGTISPLDSSGRAMRAMSQRSPSGERLCGSAHLAFRQAQLVQDATRLVLG